MTLYIIFAFALILGVGVITILNEIFVLKADINFIAEYRNTYIQFVNDFQKGSFDNERYIWLIKNSNKTQVKVGFIGIMDYKPPGENYFINKYQIIMNTIPQFRETTLIQFDINAVDNCLLRFLGVAEEERRVQSKKLFNPLQWFAIGTKQILSLPFYFLSWFGIINESSPNKIKSNIIFNIFSGIVGFVTFVSGIVTIIQGKEAVLIFFKNIFKK